MKKVAAVLISGIIAVAGLSLLFNGSSDRGTPAPEKDAPQMPSAPITRTPAFQRLAHEEAPRPAAEEDTISREEFEQMSRQDQDQAVEAFIAAFWQSESAGPHETAGPERHISLELFGRPYMFSITENEFLQLSPQEQERAIAEVQESCRQTRSHVNNGVEQARVCIAGDEYGGAEARLISALATGRELTANRSGLLLTRLVGVACQRAALREMVNLYTKAGDHAKLQIMRAHLQDLDAEVNGIRATAAEAAP